MIEWFIGEHKQDENGAPLFEAKGSSISEIERDKINSKFHFLGDIFLTRKSYDIAVRNARELQYYLDQSNLRKQALELKMPPDFIVTEVNRLIFNFCVAAQSFIDYAGKAAKHYGEDAKKHFVSYTHDLFDASSVYRFFNKLRNFCTHYSFPVTAITTSVPQYTPKPWPKPKN